MYCRSKYSSISFTAHINTNSSFLDTELHVEIFTTAINEGDLDLHLIIDENG